MLETTVDEVTTALAGAKNLNSALKTFLKREGTQTPQLATFAKEFRGVVSGGRPEPVRLFIEENYEKRPMYFLGLARYAYPELIETVVGRIIEQHADTFNTTYERAEQGIKVTDAQAFDSIVKSVAQMIDEGLTSSNVPASNFMRNAIMASVFEPDVLTEVLKVVK
ncbi:MAG: hypothetical protein RIS36_823 [Pseudomonadota bacterium]|jgi:hypothetical protein